MKHRVSTGGGIGYEFIRNQYMELDVSVGAVHQFQESEEDSDESDDFAGTVGVEILFRGLVHGSLATAFRINRDGEPWRLSIPILVSSVLYASCIASHIGAAWPPLWAAWIPADLEAALPVAGGFLFGTVTGLARERSESVAELVMLTWFALAACLAFVPI